MFNVKNITLLCSKKIMHELYRESIPFSSSIYSPLTEAVNGQENNQKPVLRACFSFWGLCIHYVMSLSPG